MKLNETRINIGGMLRCCVATIETLASDIDYPDKLEMDCKYESERKKSIILENGVWRWNNEGEVFLKTEEIKQRLQEFDNANGWDCGDGVDDSWFPKYSEYPLMVKWKARALNAEAEIKELKALICKITGE